MSGPVTWHRGSVPRGAREAVTGGPGATVWLTGLSASGKSTIAHRVEESLVSGGRAAYVLDGDNVRHGLNQDLGFSAADRSENVRRVGEVARLLADAGLVALAPLISPYEADRRRVAAAHAAADLPFFLVHVATPIEECERRDPKGLYARARAGEITGFTGIDDPYEVPSSPDLVVDTSTATVEACAKAVRALLGTG
jgi:bifunctional enzyme CysN/CysC